MLLPLVISWLIGIAVACFVELSVHNFDLKKVKECGKFPTVVAVMLMLNTLMTLLMFHRMH